ncbi:hypothetical protein BZA77DRAFT_89701 [Pyronema omphalodes]|nr:hypothetical protein BZA77DRAFT_89701 [Pyronema omphalodes]
MNSGVPPIEGREFWKTHSYPRSKVKYISREFWSYTFASLGVLECGLLNLRSVFRNAFGLFLVDLAVSFSVCLLAYFKLSIKLRVSPLLGNSEKPSYV